MKDLATNKRARFDYDILSTYEAGLVLTGQEVKAVKTGHMSLKGAFVTLHNNELYLTNALIPRYEHASPKLPHDPHRSRKRQTIKKREDDRSKQRAFRGR